MDKVLRLKKIIEKYDTEKLELHKMIEIFEQIHNLNAESKEVIHEIFFDSYLFNKNLKRKI